MADKITLQTVDTLQNQVSALSKINSNFSTIAEKLDTLVSRDGDSPNQMETNLDMNSYKVTNLAAPTNNADAVRKVDLDAVVSDGISDGDKGDITVSSSGTVFTIDSGVVSNSKLASMAEGTVKLRLAGSGIGVPIDATVAQLRTFLGNKVTKNLFPNTKWLVATALSATTKYSAAAATMGDISVSSYTTGSNTVVCSTSDTSNVILGGLVEFDPPADSIMSSTWGIGFRVTAVVTNTSFTIVLPLNTSPSTSSACSARMVDVGGAASAGTGHGFDKWTKTSTLQCWRDSWSQNSRGGSKYSLGLKKGSSSAEYYYHSVDTNDIASLEGKTITVGGYVKCPSGASWRIFINDDVDSIRYGSSVSTTGYTWSEISFDISEGVSYIHIGFEFTGSSGDAFYLSEPVMGVGDYIGSFSHDLSFSPTRFIPVVKISPATLNNANFNMNTVADAGGDYSFIFDLYAETNGCFAPEVPAVDILIEGVDSATVATGSAGSAFAMKDVEVAPIKYGPIMFQQVADVKIATGGTLTLSGNGKAYIYGKSGHNWYNVSMDINGVWI